ncbi:SAC3 domain-containing protein 1 isoform X1 [Rhynchophorus ferrugineus]|uniref:SAC3 domain-containing protein 1 isoform X1 n=1 Tax=Rhynchophorus ferrugineus TaxID=354439 RepID=UPI003FCD5057
MDSLHSFIKGECMEMCPKDEITFRVKEKLVHTLEVDPNFDNNNKSEMYSKRMVKSFSRSAAGKSMQDPKQLRPTAVLLKTVHYLLKDVIINDRVPWNVTCDFITDRLRSVRQDMVVQSLPVVDCINILQPIVNFYAYASYRSCNESISNFDPVLHRRQFQECIKRLLCLYDECDHKKICNKAYEEIQKSRPYYEALYVLLNLGNTDALSRAIRLRSQFKTKKFKLAVSASLALFENNFVRVCKILKQFSGLLLAVVCLHLPEIRKQTLKVMSVAYNSKNLIFPFSILKKLFLYENLGDVISDCTYYGLTSSEDGVYFIKLNFKEDELTKQPTHLDFVNEHLKTIEVPKLILDMQFIQ